eukprot:gene36382-44134_t
MGIAYLNFFGGTNEDEIADEKTDSSGPFSLPPRVQAYCHRSVPLENASLSNGVEAELLELQRLIITIRHGDRSSIHRLPNAVYADKRNAQQLFRPEVKSYLGYLDKIKLAAEPSKNPLAPKGENLAQVLDVSRLFSVPDDSLHAGQLTSQGFMQHIELGQTLRSKYLSFLSSITSPQQVYVRSTNYARTILSVSALLSSLVFSSTGGVPSVRVDYFEAEEDEVMHGVGLRSSSHLPPTPPGSSVLAGGERFELPMAHATSVHNSTTGAEVEYAGKCSKAAQLSRQQKAKFVSQVPYAQLAKVFGGAVKSMGATDLADSVLPHVCHHHLLPCTHPHTPNASGRGCLTSAHFHSIMASADRYYCDRFSGAQGGIHATSLSFRPFFSELLRSLTHPTYKLSVFSGHDTVIAPLLAILLGKEHVRCRWPGYASRIVMEVWKDKQAGEMTHYVRVVYNGEDITQLIGECRKSRGELRGAGGVWQKLVLGGSTLCPLSALQNIEKDMLGGQNTFEEACKV